MQRNQQELDTKFKYSTVTPNGTFYFSDVVLPELLQCQSPELQWSNVEQL